MEETKELMAALRREIELLKDLVKAKDDLIQAMKFAPAPILVPYPAPAPLQVGPTIQPLGPYNPLTPPYIVTCQTNESPKMGNELPNLGNNALLAESRAAESIALTQTVNKKLDEMGIGARNVSLIWNKSKAE